MHTKKKDIKFWKDTIENLKKHKDDPFALELIENIKKTIENLKKGS